MPYGVVLVRVRVRSQLRTSPRTPPQAPAREFQRAQHWGPAFMKGSLLRSQTDEASTMRLQTYPPEGRLLKVPSCVCVFAPPPFGRGAGLNCMAAIWLLQHYFLGENKIRQCALARNPSSLYLQKGRCALAAFPEVVVNSPALFMAFEKVGARGILSD